MSVIHKNSHSLSPDEGLFSSFCCSLSLDLELDHRYTQHFLSYDSASARASKSALTSSSILDGTVHVAWHARARASGRVRKENGCKCVSS